MSVNPYLFFSGTCRDAFTRYHEVFGGDLVILPMSEAPPEARPAGVSDDLVMHAALKLDDGLLMASDDPTGDGGPAKGVAISFSCKDAGEARRVFDGLADGGEVTMPLTEVFWSPLYGMCTDRFGISWMVSVDAPEGGA